MKSDLRIFKWGFSQRMRKEKENWKTSTEIFIYARRAGTAFSAVDEPIFGAKFIFWGVIKLLWQMCYCFNLLKNAFQMSLVAFKTMLGSRVLFKSMN